MYVRRLQLNLRYQPEPKSQRFDLFVSHQHHLQIHFAQQPLCYKILRYAHERSVVSYSTAVVAQNGSADGVGERQIDQTSGSLAQAGNASLTATGERTIVQTADNLPTNTGSTTGSGLAGKSVTTGILGIANGSTSGTGLRTNTQTADLSGFATG